MERHNRIVHEQEFVDMVTGQGTAAPDGTSTNPQAPDRDPILDFIDSLQGGSESGLSFRIDRMLNSRQLGGKVATNVPGLNWEFCAEVPVTYSFLTDLQMVWGGGTYRITCQDEKKRFVRKFYQTIAEPDQMAAMPAANGMMVPVYRQPPAPPLQNRLSDLADVANQLNQIRKTFEWDRPIIPPPPPAPAAPGERSFEDRKFDLLLALIGKNDTAADKVLSILAPEPAPTTVWDTIGETVKTLLPAVAPIIQAGIMQFVNNRAAQQHPNGQPMPPAAAPPIIHYQPPPPPTRLMADQGGPGPGPGAEATADPLKDGYRYNGESAGDEPEEPIMDLLAGLTELLIETINTQVVDPALINRGAGWIQEFRVEMPTAALIIDNLIMGPPQSVLAALAMGFPDAAWIQNQPAAIEFVRQLQVTLGTGGTSNDSSVHEADQGSVYQSARRERRRSRQG